MDSGIQWGRIPWGGATASQVGRNCFLGFSIGKLSNRAQYLFVSMWRRRQEGLRGRGSALCRALPKFGLCWRRVVSLALKSGEDVDDLFSMRILLQFVPDDLRNLS